MRTRVKICGITREADAQAAVEHGADALGFVFYPPSPRCVAVATAARIVRSLPPFVTTVALFVDATAEQIAEVVEQVGVDLLQFHGGESPAACEGHRRPWIRAVRMRGDIDLAAESVAYHAARGLLLDAYRPGVPGGTGERFDWDRIPPEMASRIILAGGLTADNVGRAVREVRPFAVDVSGGVECEKGIKDATKIKRFIDEVRSAER
jgi:phosphoribosylanthranilate isomerase